MIKKTLLITSLFVSGIVFAQEKHQISGTIYQNNNKPLASAKVIFYLNNKESNLITDENGGYFFSTESGSYQLSIYVEGFEYITKQTRRNVRPEQQQNGKYAEHDPFIALHFTELF